MSTALVERRQHPRRQLRDYALVRLGTFVGQADVVNISMGGVRLTEADVCGITQASALLFPGTGVLISLRGHPYTVWGPITRVFQPTHGLVMQIKRCSDMDGWRRLCSGMEEDSHDR